MLLTLAGCAGGRSGSAPDSPVALPRPSETTASAGGCTSDGVRFALGGADAAMGVRVLGIEIVNCGAGPLTVNGYPRLRLFGDGQEPLEVTVRHGSADVASVPSLDVPPLPVDLPPGGSAWSGMVWRNLVTDPTVTATTGVGLDVAVGPDSDWQRVPMVLADGVPVTIDLGNTGELGVGPWQRRTPPRGDDSAPPSEQSRPPDDERRT